MDNPVKLWPASDWIPIKTFKGHASSANSVVKPSDEKTLAIDSKDKTVK
jgi:WD40 repeat protein